MDAPIPLPISWWESLTLRLKMAYLESRQGEPSRCCDGRLSGIFAHALKEKKTPACFPQIRMDPTWWTCDKELIVLIIDMCIG